jgi:lambda repressor-like predicted transcriptional regulator
MAASTVHIGNLISAKLKENGRSVAWLAKQINTDRCNLSRTLKKEFIHSELLWQIADVLNINIFIDIATSFKEKKEIK